MKLTSSDQQIYQITWEYPKALKIEATKGTSYTITYNHNTKKIKCDVSEGGSTGSGSEGSGGSTPDDTWAETENRLMGRVYTQGYYLAGNFFSFSGEKVTYDDAVFKFQQQKNDDDGNAVYMVEIPASVTAHAQIMSVNELGKAVKVYGPGSAYGISRNNPQVSQSVSNTSLVSSTTFDEGTNYWNITSRNETSSEYTDGIYEVFITIDKKQANLLSVSSNMLQPSVWHISSVMPRMRLLSQSTTLVKVLIMVLAINFMVLLVSLQIIHIM